MIKNLKKKKETEINVFQFNGRIQDEKIIIKEIHKCKRNRHDNDTYNRPVIKKIKNPSV